MTAEAATDTVLSDGSSARWRRYTGVAIALHWAIGALILALLATGLWMVEAVEADETRATAYAVYQIHKSIGLAVLALTLLRVVWRILHPAPPLPETMSGLERFGARVSHAAFYVLMIGMPISGWAMVSSSPMDVPTYWFGLFEVPHIPWLSALGLEAKEALEASLKSSHATAGWIMIALIILHVGAALKHHFVYRDTVLARMAPGVSPRGEARAPDAPASSFAGWRVLASLAILTLAGGGVYSVVAGGGGATSGAAAVSVEMTTEAQRWTPVLDESAVNFSGEVDGVGFEGRFEGWSAQIAFDPDSLEASEVMVTMDVTTATIDDPLYDEPMRGEGWFNAGAHPTASFDASAFEPAGEPGAFFANGTVTIRGVALPATLPFTLVVEGDRATAEGAVTINRLDFGVGADPDPMAPTVSEEITVSIKVVADRAAP